WDTLLIVVWAMASALMLCLLALTSWRLHRRARDWPRRDVEGVSAWVADDVGPAVFGLFKPRIVLPLWLLDAPTPMRRLAVQHEQTHIAGRDPSLLIAALILVAMAPWNPALWLLLRRLRFAIELDCDARMLRSGLDAAVYSETLLAVSQRQSPTPL